MLSTLQVHQVSFAKAASFSDQRSCTLILCAESSVSHCHDRFIHGDDDERRSLFKMIPRIAEGSWVIKQSVGTTPVIIGRKLTTSFHITSKYVEVAVDVGSSTTAAYVTGMVSGSPAMCNLSGQASGAVSGPDRAVHGGIALVLRSEYDRGHVSKMPVAGCTSMKS
jgi:hypothetical protein